MDAVHTVSPQVPRSTPKMVLHFPLSQGGFGCPRLVLTLALRYAAGVAAALNSRNALVRDTTRWLWTHRPKPLGADDFVELDQVLQAPRLMFSLPPHAQLRPAICVNCIQRSQPVGPMLVVSDGSWNEKSLGWGAVVADAEGVPATTSGGIRCLDGHSCAAEWLGKLSGLLFGLSLGIAT